VRLLGLLTRVWLVAIALLCWTPEVLAEGAVWKQKHLLVDDYTSAVWQPVIAETVASFNAVLPKRAPQLVCRALGEQSCGSLPDYGQPRAISVCNRVVSDGDGLTDSTWWQHEFRRVKITLEPTIRQSNRLNVTCHEFMHALTNIPDQDGDPEPDTSCVWGDLSAPGSFDIAYIKRVYRKYAKPRK
jgi:hypothetical protein